MAHNTRVTPNTISVNVVFEDAIQLKKETVHQRIAETRGNSTDNINNQSFLAHHMQSQDITQPSSTNDADYFPHQDGNTLHSTHSTHLAPQVLQHRKKKAKQFSYCSSKILCVSTEENAG